jgi:hypothetical protein
MEKAAVSRCGILMNVPINQHTICYQAQHVDTEFCSYIDIYEEFI